MAVNGNGKLLYWILGALLTVTLAAGGFLVQRVNEQSATTQQARIDVTRLQETLTYLVPLVGAIQKKQTDRTQRFADIRERLLLFDQRLEGFGNRLDTQSKRILSLAERIDRLASGLPQ